MLQNIRTYGSTNSMLLRSKKRRGSMTTQAEQILENNLVAQLQKLGNQIEQSQEWKKGLLQKMFV